MKNVAEAASIGIARNNAPQVDVEALIEKALGGIDAALLQAVEANRKALEQFVSGGVSLTEKPLKDALANVEKMEDVFFSTVAKAAQSAGPLQGPWQSALDSFRAKGSATGSQAAQTVETLLGQAQTMLRDSRATGMRAAQAMLDSYAALASGVLIGMSEGLQAGTKRSGGGSGAGSGAAASSPSGTPASAKRTLTGRPSQAPRALINPAAPPRSRRARRRPRRRPPGRGGSGGPIRARSRRPLAGRVEPHLAAQPGTGEAKSR